MDWFEANAPGVRNTSTGRQIEPSSSTPAPSSQWWTDPNATPPNPSYYWDQDQGRWVFSETGQPGGGQPRIVDDLPGSSPDMPRVISDADFAQVLAGPPPTSTGRSPETAPVVATPPVDGGLDANGVWRTSTGEPIWTRTPGSAAYQAPPPGTPSTAPTPTTATTAGLSPEQVAMANRINALQGDAIPVAQFPGYTPGQIPYDSVTGNWVYDPQSQVMRRVAREGGLQPFNDQYQWDPAGRQLVAIGATPTPTPGGSVPGASTPSPSASSTLPPSAGLPSSSAAAAAATAAMQTQQNGNPTYWQNVGQNFGSLLEPWGTAFSYEAFQSPEPFVAGTLKTPADLAANPTPQPGVPDWSTDPGYDFRLREGQKALERSAAAKGTLLNGGTLKALNDYSQNVASDEYSRIYGRKYGEYTDQYNRSKSDWTTAYNKALGEYQQAFNVFNTNQGNLNNRVSNLAGMGQTSVNQLAQTGLGYSQINANNSSSFANLFGNLTTQGANARAAGVMGSSNAWTNYGNQLGDLLSSYPWQG